jgi:hypothetical protein
MNSSGYFQTNCGRYTSTGTTQDFSIPPHQPFPLTALGQVLLHAKDKDHLYPAYLRDNRGPVGVDEDLPQAPYVFPNDETKAEHADIQPLRDDLDNYPSAIDAMREVRKDYSEERQLGMTAGPFHTKQALQTYLKSEDFIIIPLGRKDEGLSTDGKPKGRNIQDGNRVGLSGHIHSHTHTRGELGGIQDKRHGMSVCHQNKTPIITIKYDVSKAHRRTAIPDKDRKYMVVQLTDEHGTPEYWVNLVHTYGVASAQHYWGRTAACFVRLQYYLSDEVQYVYVFVDDYSLLVTLNNPMALAAHILLFVETYGLPIAYHKIYIGYDETYVGYITHLKTHQLDITEEKKVGLQQLADSILPGKPILLKTVATYTHRLAWAVQVLELLRAFLAPLYAFLAGHGSNDKDGKTKIRTPSALVRFCVLYIQTQLKRTPSQSSDFRQRIPGTGATDAGTGDNRAGVGGWHGTDTTNKWNVDWFMVPITPPTHAWAYKKDNDPQRFIAALELLGDVYYTEYIATKYPGCAGTHYAPATTDNQGNSYIITKHYTSTFPNQCLVMELVDRLTRADLYLRVEHRERTHNVWADQLADLDSTGFNPARRWHPSAPLTIFDLTYKLAQQLGLDQPRKMKHQEYLRTRLEERNEQGQKRKTI